ncbi:uncharacterized protein LOC111079319 [Drosophila obscura]|uniref:uncharacterized protein LOC111079319 n=1 Tax=Drosophila obscura TaxID=7282 RepID=UPI001BB28436|nr:uncharacterized protein LOC111079319 [Drosophila obscura]
MSLFLDVVQRLVLQKAYELTQCAAYRVLGKCIKLDEDTCKRTTSSNGIPIKSPRPEPPAKPMTPNREGQVPEPPGREHFAQPNMADMAKTGSQSEIIWQFNDERDIPRNNSGLIDPPQMSCMRVCRDSYFS